MRPRSYIELSDNNTVPQGNHRTALLGGAAAIVIKNIRWGKWESRGKHVDR